MKDAEILSLSVTDMVTLLSDKKLSSVEITKAYLDSIGRQQESINVYITVLYDEAIAQAEKADNARASGEATSRINGIPVAIKDNICTKGIRTTCASKMLSEFVPPYNATVVDKLIESGAVILGKTNMDEFGMGSTCQNSFFGETKNPLDVTKVPGGSSGGSAAAIASLQTPVALGSDTGGSVRLPASNCGVVGLKPTYSSVSRYGLIAFASSLDQIGVIGRNISDTAILLDEIRGYDSKDSTSSKREYRSLYSALSKKTDKKLRVGVPDECFSDYVSEDVKTAYCNAIKMLEKFGAEIIRINSIPYKQALAAYYILSSAEASSNLSRFDGVRYGYRAQNVKNTDELFIKSRSEGFGDEVKKRILLGTFVLSSGYYDDYYLRATAMKNRITSDFNCAFKNVDVIITPTSPRTALSLEHMLSCTEIYKTDMFTISPSLAGLPALSVPCGKGKDNMPIGLQIIGNYFCEETLLRAGLIIEEQNHE